MSLSENRLVSDTWIWKFALFHHRRTSFHCVATWAPCRVSPVRWLFWNFERLKPEMLARLLSFGLVDFPGIRRNPMSNSICEINKLWRKCSTFDKNYSPQYTSRLLQPLWKSIKKWISSHPENHNQSNKCHFQAFKSNHIGKWELTGKLMYCVLKRIDVQRVL